MDVITEYFEKEKALKDFFGFTDGNQVYPIADYTKYWWNYNYNQVKFFDSSEAFETNDEMHSYAENILRDVTYPKSIYPAEYYTLIMLDTQVDGNKVLAIFNNHLYIPIIKILDIL